MTSSSKWPIDKSGPLFLEFNRCEDTIQLYKQIANSVTWPLYLPWRSLTFAFNLLYEDWITLRRWLFAWFWKKKIRISKSLFFNFSSRSKPWCLSKPATFKLRQNFIRQSWRLVFSRRRRNRRNDHRGSEPGPRCFGSRGVHDLLSFNCSVCGRPRLFDRDLWGFVLCCGWGKSGISETGPKGVCSFVWAFDGLYC